MKIIPSKNKKFKYTAYFKLDNGKEKKTNFGAKGMSDYTIHKDKDRRERYRKRAINQIKNPKTGPMSASYLSYYLLWGDSTSLGKNIIDYKKKFNL